MLEAEPVVLFAFHEELGGWLCTLGVRSAHVPLFLATLL